MPWVIEVFYHLVEHTSIIYQQAELVNGFFVSVCFGLPKQQKLLFVGAGGTNPHPHPQENTRTTTDNGRTDSPHEPRPTNSRQRGKRNATPTERQTSGTASTTGRTATTRKPRRTREADEANPHPQTANEKAENQQHRKHPQKSFFAFWRTIKSNAFSLGKLFPLSLFHRFKVKGFTRRLRRRRRR